MVVSWNDGKGIVTRGAAGRDADHVQRRKGGDVRVWGMREVRQEGGDAEVSGGTEAEGARPAQNRTGLRRGMRGMQLFQCDHCGTTAAPKEGTNYVEDWESVTVSTNFHYDLCSDCGRAMFKFLTRMVSPLAATRPSARSDGADDN